MLQSPAIFLQHAISDGVICVFGRQASAGVASQRASKLKTMMERQRAMARCYIQSAHGVKGSPACHNALSMASMLQIPTQDITRRIQRIQAITIVWMSVEASVALSTAWIARSPVLLAFGGDSAIELLSAVVVLWRFRSHAVSEYAERRASRIAGALLFVLAAYVVTVSALTLLRYSEPRPTYLGIAILIAAAAIMPWLAKEKRRLSSATGSAALRADSAQSALCAYLSLIALVGLGVNAIWRVAWADPVAALVVTPLIVWEGREAMRGKSCGCC
jgi:divalent metal cation (Fe/Co/Zn/Cd) transporter